MILLRPLQKLKPLNGGRYLVVFIPSKLRVVGPFCRWPERSALTEYESHLSPFRDFVIKRCKETSIALLDLTDGLIRSARAGNVPWYPGDSHWNERGHEVAAEMLAEWIRFVSTRN